MQTRATVDRFKAACPQEAELHPTEVGGLANKGLHPDETNWARQAIVPRFYGYSLRTGAAFTYLGLKVDENAQCSTQNGPIQNLWAAGETILGQGYLAGCGMTIDTVFGRIAVREAAKYAK